MKTHTITKRHATHLSPFPLELIPFEPVDSADNPYGNLYTPIHAKPYSNAGIKVFTPSQPFKESQLGPALNGLTSSTDILFPSLADLNAELFEWNEGEEESVLANDSLCTPFDIFNTAAVTSPLPPTHAPTAPSVPLIGPLTSPLLF